MPNYFQLIYVHTHIHEHLYMSTPAAKISSNLSDFFPSQRYQNLYTTESSTNTRILKFLARYYHRLFITAFFQKRKFVNKRELKQRHMHECNFLNICQRCSEIWTSADSHFRSHFHCHRICKWNMLNDIRFCSIIFHEKLYKSATFGLEDNQNFTKDK